MRGDFSRLTFRPERHFSGVRLQQGRVLLDADFNEQTDIAAEREAALAEDAVGLTGAPVVDGGLAIEPSAHLLAAAISPSGHALAVGSRGTILASAPTAPWTAAVPPAGLRADLRGVAFGDADHAWAVGTGGTILASSDRGGKWEAQGLEEGVPRSLNAVHFTDARRGWAVGNGATLLATEDGEHWTALDAPSAVRADLRGVHFSGASAGWAVGDGGAVLATTDGGATWALQFPPDEAGVDLLAVHALSTTAAIAVGHDATILTTDDGGAHWTRRPVPSGVTAALRAVASDGKRALAAGDGATLLQSFDGGVQWSVVPETAELAETLRALATAGGRTIVAGDHRALAGVGAGEDPPLKPASLPETARDLALSAGRFYVEGLTCELERRVLVSEQPDLPGTYGVLDDVDHVVYLDAWERDVSALERPELREVALGGPDTTTRRQVVAQVGLITRTDCAMPVPAEHGRRWSPFAAPERGRLRARSEPAEAGDACMVPSGGGYRRLENQLYRVEIEDAGDPHAFAYTWSRDNASVATTVEAIDLAAGAVVVTQPGRDAVLAFGPGQWVELIDEETELLGRRGVLLEVAGPPAGNVVPLDGLAERLPDGMAAFSSLPRARRWDGRGEVAAGEWQELEAGVLVQLDGGALRPGDHWTIPARTATGDVEWPHEGGAPAWREPDGVRHRYAPLAIASTLRGEWTAVKDCRATFPGATGHVHAAIAGGDGQAVAPVPGDALVPLPEPLRVAVTNGRFPVEGAVVRFTAGDGGGRVAVTAPGDDGSQTCDVATDGLGIAECAWALSATADEPQLVEARLLDELGRESGAPLRFGAALSVAAGVAFDGTNCPKLSATTVQAALEQLCARTGGCTVQANPGDDLQAAIDGLPADGGEVCLSAGTFDLPGVLRLRGKRCVVVSGRGAATRLRAGPGQEIAAAFVDCDQVLVCDVAVEARAGAPSPPGQVNLNGALTFSGCLDVAVERCRLACPDSAGRAQACITVLNQEPRRPPSRVRLDANRLEVGAWQVGVLILGAAVAELSANHVRLRAAETGRPVPFGQLGLLARELAAVLAAVRRDAAGSDTRTLKARSGPKTLDIHVVKGAALGPLFDDLVHLMPDELVADGAAAGVRQFAARVSDGRLTGALAQSSRDAISAWLGAIRVVGQGIVVAGARADTVRIDRNVIDDAAQSVHVGVSDRRTGTTFSAGDVAITDTVLHAAMPVVLSRERHGIFVGNARSVTVRGTAATLRRTGAEYGGAATDADAVRVFGQLGPFLSVRETSAHGFSMAVRVAPVAPLPLPGFRMWVVAETIADGHPKATALQAPEEVEHERNYPSGPSEVVELRSLLRDDGSGLGGTLMAGDAVNAIVVLSATTPKPVDVELIASGVIVQRGIRVPANADRSASFAIVAGDTGGNQTLQAKLGPSQASAAFAVVTLDALRATDGTTPLHGRRVLAGGSTQALVRLTDKAPRALEVHITAPSGVAVPGTVAIAAGADRSAAFTITVPPTAKGTLDVTAATGTLRRTATLTAVSLTGLRRSADNGPLNDTRELANQVVQAYAQLSGPAPGALSASVETTGGIVVPGPVSFASGAERSSVFEVRLGAPDPDTGQVTVKLGALSATATLTKVALGPLFESSDDPLDGWIMSAGDGIEAFATLVADAPHDVVVTLFASAGLSVSPTSVVIEAGSRQSQAFAIRASEAAFGLKSVTAQVSEMEVVARITVHRAKTTDKSKDDDKPKDGDKATAREKVTDTKATKDFEDPFPVVERVRDAPGEPADEGTSRSFIEPDERPDVG